jgi:hypothetical protein
VSAHPIRLAIADDLGRSRLTVFFRLLLAIPHLVWFLLWSVAAVVAAIVNWFATLITGRPPLALHRFLGAYLRYSTHVFGYLFLAANPYPGFVGAPGSYPIDLEIDDPEVQPRWKTALRLLLAVPALVIDSALSGGPGNAGWNEDDWSGWSGGGGVLAVVAFLGWFACLARARMPRGFRNVVAYGLRYGAQAFGYLFVLTDRYPNADPRLPPGVGDVPDYPIRLTADDDLRRSRLTVFFRLLLFLPHLVWLVLWGIAAAVATLVNWVATLARGRSPEALHRFLAAYLRYTIHVMAFVTLVANPFPGFDGRRGSYPIDLEIDPPAPQSRWVTGFRLLLALPALVVSGALSSLLFVAAFLGWFAALATARMPQSLRNVGTYVLRYTAEVDGYLYLLTDRYPYSGPPAEREALAEPAVGATS